MRRFVAKDGAIDWLCYGRFDGGAVLCRLLDAAKGGYFHVRPAARFETTRRYVPDTSVLENGVTCTTGRLRLTDAMLLDAPAPSLVRRIEGLSGRVEVCVDWVPTFDFGQADTVLAHAPGGCEARAGSEHWVLTCPFPVQLAAGRVSASGRLEQGQTHWLGLSRRALDTETMQRGLQHSEKRWQTWSRRGAYAGVCEELVRRSALTLKLLIHSDTGSMVAAPTTSLPTVPGGERNWDYRFAWLRDASWLMSAHGRQSDS